MTSSPSVGTRRKQQVLPGQELRRLAHRLGSIVRHLPGLPSRRGAHLRSGRFRPVVQPALPAGESVRWRHPAPCAILISGVFRSTAGLRRQNVRKVERHGRLEEQDLLARQRTRMATGQSLDRIPRRSPRRKPINQ